MLQRVSHPWLPLTSCSVLLGATDRRGGAAARGARVAVGPELEGGVVKAGWRVL